MHLKEGVSGGFVRLHTNIIHSPVRADAGIRPSCSCCYPELGPYTCRSLAHGPFWKQWQEQGFSTAFLEHSEEPKMVFPSLTEEATFTDLEVTAYKSPTEPATFKSATGVYPAM